MNITTSGKLPIACPPPRIRYSSTAVQSNSNKLIYIFGGTGGQKHSHYWNDLYILDAQTWTWCEPTTCKGQLPLPRYGHTATLIEVLDENHRDRKQEGSSTYTIPTKKKMVVFGGKSLAPHHLLNDVYELDLDTLAWKKLHIRGDTPQARYYHSATDIGNGKILIFGGRCDSGELSDVVILDVPNGQWIYPPVNGKSPTKRYQHSAYFDAKREFLYIYGGINRMTSLRDLNILSLRGEEEEETMQWIKPKLRFDIDMESKAHDYSLFVDGKVVILDFEKMNRERKLDYLRFDEDEVILDTLDIVGNVPEMSQFYSFVSFPQEHILLEIKKQTSLYLLRTDARLFERETLEIKKIDVTIPSLPIVPNPSQQIPIECHYGSTPLYTFEISPSSTFSSLKNAVARKYHLDNCALLLYQRNHYVHLNTEKFPGILRRQEDGPLKIYVAASAKAEDIKKKNIDFLATEAALLGTSPSDISDSISEKSEDIKEIKKNEEVAVPLPKLFGKPVKLSFVRWMHKKMKQFEARGLTHTLLATSSTTTDETVPLLKKKDMNKREHFNVKVALGTFLRFLFLPLFTVTHLFRSASAKSKLTLLGLSFIYLLCIFLPVATLMYEHLSHEDEFLGKANVFAPIIIYFILILIFSTIEGTWKFPQKMTQELSRYRVTVLQRLVTNEYGERPAGGDEVVFALTNKEDTTKDKAWHKFITYIFPVIAAALHCLVTFFYLLETKRWRFSNDWKTHCLSGLALFLNFVMTWFFLFILGCSLTIYARQSTFIRYFNVLASREQAESLDLPTLPLTSLENTMAWIKIRSYIKGHQFLPLTSANVVLGYSIIAGVVLWMMVATQIFTSKEIFNNITVLVIYDAILMAIYIVLTLGIGAEINAFQEKHVTMLYKEQLKLSLKLRQIHVEGHKSLEEEKDQLKTCREILHIFASIIEKQENVFSILGVSMSETATKAIIGLTISITVAMIARIGVDLTE